MARVRVRVWWLMALVAVVAVGCAVIPRWCGWHHEMLRRSERAAWVVRVFEALRGMSDSATEPSERERYYRRVVTFPWLGGRSPDELGIIY